MAIAINAKITVEGGKSLSDYHSIAIRQELFAHHSFQIVVPYEVLEQDRTDGFFHQAHELYCGKTVTITLTPQIVTTDPPLVFKGIITHIALSNSGDFSNSFVLSGYSPTYLLEDGVQRRTFQKQGLQEIFNEVLKPYPRNLVSFQAPKPQHQPPVKYVVQYGESNYTFLSRLADSYGEWFYYDGEAIRLGKPTDSQALPFTVIGTEGFSMAVELRPTKFKMGRYDYLAHKPYKGSSESQSLGQLNPFAAFALQKSDALFSQPSQFQADRHIRDQGQLDTAIKEWKANQVSSLVSFYGNGENTGFGVGKVIEVQGISPTGKHDYGKYRLVEVNHTVQADQYQNSFTALPEAAEHPAPNPHVQPPAGVPELAEVIDLNDPQKLGRIKARYYWPVDEPKQAETGWLRVSTPYAGDGKGQLFTPEVGSQVLIAYEHSLAEFPVVLGNMFHPQNKQSAKYTNPQNNLKGLQTAGGNKFVMADGQGEQRILISNSNNKGTAVEVGFKGDGSITIKSNGPVTVLGSTITLEAGDKGEIMMHAKNITMEAEEEIKVTSASKSIALKAEMDITAEATAKMAFSAKEKTVSTTGKMEISSGSTVDISGSTVKING